MTERGGTNLHATAIVLGSTGILISGPSGAGKSELALALLHGARLNGLHAALVADDQVLISCVAGRVIAGAPAAIAGLIEIRGSGLAKIPHLESAVMDFALMPVPSDAAERMPPSDSTLQLEEGGDLPALFLRWPAPDPFSKLAALCPGLDTGRPALPARADAEG